MRIYEYASVRRARTKSHVEGKRGENRPKNGEEGGGRGGECGSRGAGGGGEGDGGVYGGQDGAAREHSAVLGR